MAEQGELPTERLSDQSAGGEDAVAKGDGLVGREEWLTGQGLEERPEFGRVALDVEALDFVYSEWEHFNGYQCV